MSEQQASRNEVLLLAVLIEGGAVVLASLLGWLLGVSPLEHFRFDGFAVLWGVLATLPLVGLFLIMDRWPIGPLRGVKAFGENVLRPFLEPLSLADLAGISVLAGLGEELLFRGTLQGWLSRFGGNPWIPIVLVGVMFGLIHAVTATYAILASLAGIYFGWLLQHTNNLLTPMVTHGLYDFIVLLYLMYSPRPEPPSGEPENTPPETDETDENPASQRLSQSL
jgi:uncharacterized protein